MVAPVILVEAQPRRASDGVAETILLAGAGGSKPYDFGGQHWRAGIAGLPAIVTSLDFDGENAGGGGVPPALTLRYAPAGSVALAAVARYFWIDAPITIRFGPETDALPPVLLSGAALDATVQGGALNIAMADPAAQLKRPLLTERFAGTGDLEGPEEFKGQLKPRAWGPCFNVPGRLLDRANNIWCFGDPTRRWLAIDVVRDAGVTADPADLLSVAWQGSAAATLAALRAMDAPPGGGVLCPDLACVKWWSAETSGDLHADVRGEIAGGYVDTAPEIVSRVVAGISTQPFAAGTIAAAKAARPAVFGRRYDDESTTAADALSEMLGDVSTSWILIGDQIVLRPWTWGPSNFSARSYAVTRREVFKPVGTRRLGYRRNHHTMARGDLAALVFATDVVMSDGTTADELAEDVADLADPNVLTGDRKAALLSQLRARDAVIVSLVGEMNALPPPLVFDDPRVVAHAGAVGALGILNDLLADLIPPLDDLTASSAVDGEDLTSRLEAYDIAIAKFETAMHAGAPAGSTIGGVYDPETQEVIGGMYADELVTSLNGVLSDQVISRAEKPSIDRLYTDNVRVMESAAIDDVTYPGARSLYTALMAKWNAIKTVFDNFAPPITDYLHDTPIAEGVNLKTLFDDYAVALLAWQRKVRGAAEPFIAELTNDSAQLPVDATNAVTSFDGSAGTMTVFLGNTPLTSGVTFSVTATSNAAATIHATNGTYAATSLTAQSGWIEYTVSHAASGRSATKRMTLVKGGQGGKSVKLVADRDAITFSGTGALNPASQTTTFTLTRVNVSSTPSTVWTISDLNGNNLSASTYLSIGGETATMTAAAFNTARGSTQGVRVTAYVFDGIYFYDSEQVTKVADGSVGPAGAGTPGQDGQYTVTVYLRTGATQAATPTSTSSPPLGWTVAVPTDNGLPLWSTTADFRGGVRISSSWSTPVKTLPGGIEDGADKTTFNHPQTTNIGLVTVPTTITFTDKATSSDNVSAVSCNCKRYSGTDDVTAQSTWSCVSTAGLNATVSNGVVSVPNMQAAIGYVIVTSIYDGLPAQELVTFMKTYTVASFGSVGTYAGFGANWNAVGRESVYTPLNRTPLFVAADGYIFGRLGFYCRSDGLIGAAANVSLAIRFRPSGTTGAWTYGTFPVSGGTVFDYTNGYTRTANMAYVNFHYAIGNSVQVEIDIVGFSSAAVIDIEPTYGFAGVLS
jgi:hypothetical protein